MYSSFKQHLKKNINIDNNTVQLMIYRGVNDWNWGLRLACYRGSIEIVNLMISKGAYDWNLGTVLCMSRRTHMDIVNLFDFQRHADEVGTKRRYLAHVCGGQKEIVNLMIVQMRC